MADQIERLYMQFVTSAVITSESAELGGTLPKFDPMRNYKACEPVFRSVKAGDSYYSEAQYLLTLCELSKSVLEPNRLIAGSVSPRLAERAQKACEAIAEKKSDDAYIGFMLYAIVMNTKFYTAFLDFESHMLQQSANSYNRINAQSRNLYAAGVDGGAITSQARGAMNDLGVMGQKLEATKNGVEDFLAKSYLALVENLKNPNACEQEVLDSIQSNADAYSRMKVPAASGLSLKVRNTLRSNQERARVAANEARLRAIREEQERKKKEEEERKKKLEEAVDAWWESHPGEKSKLESHIADLEAQIAKAGQECDDLQKRQQEAIRERDERGEAETEQEKIHARLVELRRGLSRAKSREIPPTSSEIDRDAAISELSSKRDRLNHLTTKVISVEDSTLPSAKTRDGLTSEIDGYEQELASLGIFSWGKKRKLYDLIVQKKAELEEANAKVEEERAQEAARLEQERSEAIARLQDEIDALDAKVSELKQLATEERAAAEAEKSREVEEAEAQVSEFEPIAKQANQRAEEEKKARRDRLQPTIDELGKSLATAKSKKEALQQELTKARNELKNPDMPEEFLSGYLGQTPDSEGESLIAASNNEEESPKADGPISVVVTDFGNNKISVVKEVRSATSLGLREALDAVEKGVPIPCESKAMASDIVSAIEMAGGRAVIK